MLSFTQSEFERVTQSVMSYRTQILDLFLDRDGFVRETDSYTDSLGCANYAERYWHPA